MSFEPVSTKKWGSKELKPSETHRATPKGGPSFGEMLRSQKTTLKENAKHPPSFPKSSSSEKHITTEQAKRLARYAPLIQEAASKHQVPIELICGVILQESGGNPRAISTAGAKGLMQLMDGTAHRFGVRNSFDPAQNIEGGTKYLRFLLDRFNGNVELTLAAYNAGEKNVEKYGMKIPPFAETQSYVPSVLGYCKAMIAMLQTNQKIG